MKTALAAGVLLTAESELMEPAFMRSVIYLLEHHDGGSMGVILNRPLEMALDTVWEACPDRLNGHMFCASGGPVEQQKGILLHRYAGLADAYKIDDSLYIGGDHVALLKAVASWESHESPPLRLFLGHAGWAPGQLQNEVERGTWIVAPGHANLVLNNQPDDDFWETRIRVGEGFPGPSFN